MDKIFLKNKPKTTLGKITYTVSLIILCILFLIYKIYKKKLS